MRPCTIWNFDLTPGSKVIAVGVGPRQKLSLIFLGYFTFTSLFLHRFTSNWYWTSLMTIRSISTMHGPIPNPGAPRPHRPHPPKISIYYNFFISTRIHFKLILNFSYDIRVNLNYAWPHYQPWGPAHIDHTRTKLPFTIISSFLHRFTSNWYWTSLMTIRSISTMHGTITNPGAPCPHMSHPPKIAFYYNFFISTPIHF